MKDVSGCWKLDIATVAHDISTRSLSPVALAEMMLDRIARIDPKLLSYVTVLKDDAISSASQAEKEIADGHYRGVLHGVPIAIKDIYDTKGVRTTACSKVRENYVPAEDSTVVRKFREAGAVILGKVTTHEFAFGFELASNKECLEPEPHSVGVERRVRCSNSCRPVLCGDRQRYRRIDPRTCGGKRNRRNKTDLRPGQQGRGRRPFLVPRSRGTHGQNNA